MSQNPDKVSGDWTCPACKKQAGCVKKRASPKSFDRVGKTIKEILMKHKKVNVSEIEKDILNVTALSNILIGQAVYTSVLKK